MAEYIDKEALIGKIKGFTSDVIFRGNHKLMRTGKDSCNPAEWTRGYEQGVLDTNNLIAGTQAADVVGVKHGTWLPQIVLGQKAWDCSECKTLGSLRWKWCPMCGAKMDGERRASDD